MKALLYLNGLKESGKKDELVARLTEKPPCSSGQIIIDHRSITPGKALGSVTEGHITVAIEPGLTAAKLFEKVKSSLNMTSKPFGAVRLMIGNEHLAEQHQLWLPNEAAIVPVTIMMRVRGGGKRFVRSCSSDEEEPEPPKGPKFLKPTRCRDLAERKSNKQFNAQAWATYNERKRARSAGWVTKKRKQESDDESDEDIGLLTPKYVEPVIEMSGDAFMARFSKK